VDGAWLLDVEVYVPYDDNCHDTIPDLDKLHVLDMVYFKSLKKKKENHN
jgi:hypothetical protein